MIAQPKTPPTRMTVDEYLAWAEGRTGRHELVDGEVFAMSPERIAHAEMKFTVQKALEAAILSRRLPCRVLPDGVTVRIDATTAFEPDALVYCGPRLAPDALLVDNPMIVVEVLSPSTARNDISRKLAGYFRLPSVAHYLIIDPDEPLVIHHQRREGGDILTRIYREGTIALDPPGLEISLAEIYELRGS
jgi:Uma2 family endonuclease